MAYRNDFTSTEDTGLDNTALSNRAINLGLLKNCKGSQCRRGSSPYGGCLYGAIKDVCPRGSDVLTTNVSGQWTINTDNCTACGVCADIAYSQYRFGYGCPYGACEKGTDWYGTDHQIARLSDAKSRIFGPIFYDASNIFLYSGDDLPSASEGKTNNNETVSVEDIFAYYDNISLFYNALDEYSDIGMYIGEEDSYYDYDKFAKKQVRIGDVFLENSASTKNVKVNVSMRINVTLTGATFSNPAVNLLAVDTSKYRTGYICNSSVNANASSESVTSSSSSSSSDSDRNTVNSYIIPCYFSNCRFFYYVGGGSESSTTSRDLTMGELKNYVNRSAPIDYATTIRPRVIVYMHGLSGFTTSFYTTKKGIKGTEDILHKSAAGGKVGITTYKNCIVLDETYLTGIKINTHEGSAPDYYNEITLDYGDIYIEG